MQSLAGGGRGRDAAARRAHFYRVIEAMIPHTRPQGANHVTYLCGLARLSRAGFYRRADAKAPAKADTELRAAIHVIALEHKAYGYRPMTAALRREGFEVNRKRVLRLMREDNLLSLRSKAFVPKTTDSRHGFLIVPNRIRDLVPSGPDQIWAADITYIRLDEAFVYLAAILDAFSRRVIGWALEDHLRAELCLEALDMAIASRKPCPGSLIHHSDRGVQYACHGYAGRLKAHGIIPSMSGAGNPYDNAKAESFMKTLKKEEVGMQTYRTLEDARSSIGCFLETTYNTKRLHSSLGYLPPVEFETNFRQTNPI
ncbi:MAG: IS3 family transposase [Aestuariivirga sp.]